MDLLTRYLYLWGSFVALTVFGIIFYVRPDLRRRMVRVGIAVGIAGILSEAVFFRDYWHPQLLVRFGPFGGIEDLLFGFAIGGIAASLYDTVFHQRLRRKGHPHAWIVPALVVSELLAIIVLFYGLHLNSIFASAAGFAAPAVAIAIVRRDLILEIIFSALLFGALLAGAEMGALIFAPTYLAHYYALYGHAPLILGIVPLTEFLWGAAFASTVGPLVDFDTGFAPVAIARQRIAARRQTMRRKQRVAYLATVHTKRK